MSKTTQAISVVGSKHILGLLAVFRAVDDVPQVFYAILPRLQLNCCLGYVFVTVTETKKPLLLHRNFVCKEQPAIHRLDDETASLTYCLLADPPNGSLDLKALFERFENYFMIRVFDEVRSFVRAFERVQLFVVLAANRGPPFAVSLVFHQPKHAVDTVADELSRFEIAQQHHRCLVQTRLHVRLQLSGAVQGR